VGRGGGNHTALENNRVEKKGKALFEKRGRARRRGEGATNKEGKNAEEKDAPPTPYWEDYTAVEKRGKRPITIWGGRRKKVQSGGGLKKKQKGRLKIS